MFRSIFSYRRPVWLENQAVHSPPVTFGPARRLGARGAYILKADLGKKAWVPTDGWVGVE